MYTDSMSAYKPSELRAALNAYGIAAKKRFSQNFLIDLNILNKIVKAAQIQSGDTVLEIGAGPGALTQVLLDCKADVTAIEIDPGLVKILGRLQKHPQGSLEIVQADVLDLSLKDLCLQKAQKAKKKIKIVANLPYHITTPLLTQIVPLYESVESVTVMVQREFAERMVAKNGTRAYGHFTLFLDYYSEAKLQFIIKPACFYPSPQVDSALIQCHLHKPFFNRQEGDSFFRMTRMCFQKKRKMLRTSLKELYPVEKMEETLKQMGLNLKARPEELSLDQFISLFHNLAVGDRQYDNTDEPYHKGEM